MERLRPRSLRAPWFPCLVVATLLSHAVLAGVRTLISYRALALGGDAVTVGLVTGAFALLPLVVALHIGRAVDRGRGVLVVRLGLILTVAAVLVAAASPSAGFLIGASAVLGLGQILHTVACQSLIPLWSPPEKVDDRFGQLTLGVSAGQLVGFPVAGSVATLTNAGATTGEQVATTPALLVMAGLAALAVPLAFWFVPADRIRVSRADASAVRQSTLAILGTRGMKPAVYSSLTVLTGMDLLMAYLPLLGQSMGLGVGAVTMLLTARSVASVVSRAAMPLLLRAVPRRVLLVSATLASGAPMALVPLTTDIVLLTVMMLVVGFFWGLGQPLTMSWVTTVADPHNRAAALSVRLAGNRIGQVVVPLAAGGLAGITGAGAIFHAGGLLLLSSALCTLVSTREPPAEPGRVAPSRHGVHPTDVTSRRTRRRPAGR
ncbi:MFS transporter [Pseudonocardia alni]|uniref:MFS family permease n=1 Tax=Pseudonocardia alni TaxID=33907 RepID=A0A852W405_PSEA5|nr:MFS transporter [Pseudonocardia antarctica]NYG00292.1 MFS family permease [Pseudonocardia antarctica]